MEKAKIYSLDEFRSNLNFLRKEKAKEKSASLIDVDERALTKKDMEMYYQVVGFKSTGNPVRSLLPEFVSYQKEAFGSGNRSRSDFAAFLANELGAINLKQEFKNRKAA